MITLDQLSNLIDVDKKDDNLKLIAELFLLAATDWPVPNQIMVSDFIDELKRYYGTPLTKEKISQKVLDPSGQNLWRHEAGSSIIEMLELSEQFYNHSDFERILDKIISHYSK